jgi:hypothetical protein
MSFLLEVLPLPDNLQSVREVSPADNGWSLLFFKSVQMIKSPIPGVSTLFDGI